MDNYLEHHGVKGMKWGVRKDKKTYKAELKKANKERKDNAKLIDELARSGYKDNRRTYKNYIKEINNTPASRRTKRATKRQVKSAYTTANQSLKSTSYAYQYENIKRYRDTKYKTLLEAKGSENMSVKRAKRKLESSFEGYGNATIRKDPVTGQYHITEVYYA